ncbi:MAG: TetR/AcrR family transcriptional regulator [Candidatus Rokubacteria bacterium]|nr:TetR/AcrR family transcriptional regulator [Candidatus Rokubacteria bacterium]
MGRPARIDRTVILRASLDLADERGLAAVTMQAVAERLGVTPMALYRHIANKADLLDAVQESLLTEFTLPDRRLPWRQRLAALARAARESAKRHPEVFPLLLQRAASTPGGRRVRDAICDALLDAGVPDSQVPRVERLLSTFVMGFAISEASGRFTARGIEVEADFTYAQTLVFELIDRLRAGPDRRSDAGLHPRGARPGGRRRRR